MRDKIYLSILKNKPDVLTILEVAQVLRIGKNKAYFLVNSGDIASIKLGGKFIIPKIYLIQYIIEKNSSLNHK